MRLTSLRSLPETEHADARRYWAERGFRKSYTQALPYRDFIADKVVAEGPGRVLEFGCNVGRNLFTIRGRDASIAVVGVDINPVAVAWGQSHYHLDLNVAEGSEWIAAQPDDSFDVAFTVSVIDHIAEPDEAFRQLARIAPVVLMIEPWFGKEGKVRQEDIPGTAPYSYSWDIPARMGALGFDVVAEPYVLSPDERTLGPHYVLYTCRRQAAVAEEPPEEPVVALEPELAEEPDTGAEALTENAPEPVVEAETFDDEVAPEPTEAQPSPPEPEPAPVKAARKPRARKPKVAAP